MKIHANTATLSTGEERSFPASSATPLRYEQVDPAGALGMKSTGYMFPPDGVDFTPAERREIADFMIEAWRAWSATLADEIARLSIDHLGLPARAYHCLDKAGIRTIGELCARSRSDLLRLKLMGTMSLRAIEGALAARGIRLGDRAHGGRP